MDNLVFVYLRDESSQKVIQYIEENNLQQYFNIFEIFNKETKETATVKYGVTSLPTVNVKLYGNIFRRRGEIECIKLLKDFKKELLKENIGKGPSIQDSNFMDQMNFIPPKNVSFKPSQSNSSDVHVEIIGEEDDDDDAVVEEVVVEKPIKKKHSKKKTDYKTMEPIKNPNNGNKKYDFTFNLEEMPELPDVYGKKNKDYF